MRSQIREYREFLKEPLVVVISAIIAFGLILFIIYPLVSVFIKSLFYNDELSMHYYYEFVTRKIHYRSLVNSLILASITTVITTVISFLFAYMVNRGPKHFSGYFRLMAIIPFVTPPFVFALALIILGGRQGLITKFFDLEFTIFGWKGVILAQVLHFIPLCFIMIDNVVTSLNTNLEEAGSILGASQPEILWKINIPLCMPGIIKAALMVFIVSMADFGNPALIGGGVTFIAVESYLLVVGQYNLEMASVYSIMLLLPSMILYFLQRYAIKDKEYTTIGGTSGYQEIHKVHPVIQIPMFSVCFIVSFMILLIFAVVIAGAFTNVIGINNHFTLRHFNITGSIFALKNSLLASTYAAVLGSIAGIILAYFVMRKPIPAKKFFEVTSISGFAVPGTVTGIGFILAFNHPPFLMTGTMAILVFSMIARTIAVSVEAGIAKLYQIDESVEYAAQSLGANSFHTFVRVMLPLMFTAFFGSMIYNFIHAMNTLSAVIFLASPRHTLAPISIFQLAAEGRIGQACALSMYLIICVFASLGVLYAVSRKSVLK